VRSLFHICRGKRNRRKFKAIYSIRVPKISPFRRRKQSRMNSFDGSECILIYESREKRLISKTEVEKVVSSYLILSKPNPKLTPR